MVLQFFPQYPWLARLILLSTYMKVKKLKCKMKHVEALNLMMEKQHGQMKDLEESLVTERMDILQKIFSAGVSRWRDHASVKSQSQQQHIA